MLGCLEIYPKDFMKPFKRQRCVNFAKGKYLPTPEKGELLLCNFF